MVNPTPENRRSICSPVDFEAPDPISEIYNAIAAASYRSNPDDWKLAIQTHRIISGYLTPNTETQALKRFFAGDLVKGDELAKRLKTDEFAALNAKIQDISSSIFY